MAASELSRLIDQVAKEKGIEREVLVDVLEVAMLQAAKKKLGIEHDVEAQYNDESGEVELFEFKTVVDSSAVDLFDDEIEIDINEARDLDPDCKVDDQLGIKIDSGDFGRIAAQTAKQVIIQKVRDAEREIIFGEFKDRKGEVINGIVQRWERGDIIVNLGRTDAILPQKEQVPREGYTQGDRVRALIIDVALTPKGPRIVLSRAHPDLVRKLFEQEVPEIYEGIVEIRAIAREPGGRTKIAVASRDPDIDPVGACVGVKGSRVQSVVQELRGEKIDIVPWSPDSAKFICSALAPAEISKVVIDEKSHAMKIIVDDDQLSLAIGRKGQNVRLAARLAGWKIDIMGLSEADKIAREAKRILGRIQGLGEIQIEALVNANYTHLETIIDADLEHIALVPGLDADKALTLKENAKRALVVLKEEEAAAAAA
ncbi:MAG: transcription termination factor NusA, partial [Candidatus Methylomirabilis sp.]|nr:transcription termination factor NusA [Deltaproteobacteria bacterium]